MRGCFAGAGFFPRFRRLSQCAANAGAMRGTVRGRFRLGPRSDSPFPSAAGISVLYAGAVGRDVSLKAVPGITGPLETFEPQIGVQAPTAAGGIFRLGSRKTVELRTVQRGVGSMFEKSLVGIRNPGDSAPGVFG